MKQMFKLNKRQNNYLKSPKNWIYKNNIHKSKDLGKTFL